MSKAFREILEELLEKLFNRNDDDENNQISLLRRRSSDS